MQIFPEWQKILELAYDGLTLASNTGEIYKCEQIVSSPLYYNG